MALDLLEHTSFVCQTKKFEFDNTIEDTHYVQEHSVNLFTIESFWVGVMDYPFRIFTDE